MKVIILGAGSVGRVIAWDLSKDFDVYVADIDESALQRVKDFANPIKLNANDFQELTEKIRGFDLVVGALPGFLGFKSIKAAIKVGIDMVDVSFMPEDPLKLREEAENAQVTVIFDAGFAPGLSNILMGRIWNEAEDLEEGYIYVGALPKEPRPPLYYRLTWSPKDLIEEYTRPARAIRDGRIVEVDPLSEIKRVKVGDFEFEAFLTDGLRSMLESIRARRLEEWTLRWPGHLEKMKVLKELGFFKPENLDFTLRVIAPLMEYKSRDFSIMEVIGRGEFKNGNEMRFFVYDEADERFFSVSRVTGFTTAIIARIVAEGSCTFGVIPPEILGMRIDTFKRIVDELKERGVKILNEAE
ncbi:hypothetical protein PNA2_0280 [Pyrococcus sp. NA2]|uniref:saccharopine dehydrogenase family protein n=1 Tax=Pyrococcus sp. (strain NA2) TaxID=342949 RepID=UPI000209B031|nr:saccharopine dehydrogenase family protein [Pyrococcus sp. NA2]AEC51198.1 hypothetical protein PNA2_0280 [Pyrococcus sp. NA2]